MHTHTTDGAVHASCMVEFTGGWVGGATTFCFALLLWVYSLISARQSCDTDPWTASCQDSCKTEKAGIQRAGPTQRAERAEHKRGECSGWQGWLTNNMLLSRGGKTITGDRAGAAGWQVTGWRYVAGCAWQKTLAVGTCGEGGEQWHNHMEEMQNGDAGREKIRNLETRGARGKGREGRHATAKPIT